VKRIGKVLAVLLSFAMVMGMLPVAVMASDMIFRDVAEDAWYYDAVSWAVKNGITSGVANGLFGPDNTCTRGQVVTFLWKAAGAPEPEGTATSFTDVSSDDYFYKSVLWAVENGVTGGTSPTTFSPSVPCTRAQVATFLYAAKGKPGFETTSSPFSDVKDGAWFYEPVLWAVENGVTSGVGNGLFGTNQTCTRSQIAMFLYKASQIGGETPVVTPDPSVEELPEIIKARELGLIPMKWNGNLSAEADFDGFNRLVISLITLCDESALAQWNKNVDPSAFPQRDMRRDDCLMLLMLAGEALGYNVYNARGFGFCTEYRADYDMIFSQLSRDYPYCDVDREISIYFEELGGNVDPIGDVPTTAVFWMQRRMDISRGVHFLDCDEDLNFHFDGSLTREAAIVAVVRLYNSAMLGFTPHALPMREPTEEDRALLAAAEARKTEILCNTDELRCLGTVYYVSNSGDDGNDGLSPERPWATLERVNTAELSPRDCVYFERGGLWRGQLWAQEGVSYSAYGEGEKPKIYGSPENGADPAKWTLLEGTDSIWVYHADLMDCGVIVFNDGERWATKVTPYYMDGYRSTVNEGQPFDVRTELTEDLMFFSEADSILYDGAPFRYGVWDTEDRNEYPDVVGSLYLRCDAGNPGEIFRSIEFAVRDNLVVYAADTTFHNLCLKYTGAHCLYGYCAPYDVSFCEIGWIGGCVQYYRYDSGEPVRYGNGVECDGSYDHFSVTDCYIYQCFDAGVTNQDPAEPPEVTGGNVEYLDSIQRNIIYVRNVFAYNDMPVEIFFTLEDDAGYGRHRMENVLIKENYFLYTGYGWAGLQDNKAEGSAAYMGHWAPNASENFRIINNVFYLSTGPLLQTAAPKKWQPELDGNTYVQNEGGVLITWLNDDGYVVPFGFYYNDRQDTVTDVIREILGDRHATVLKN